MLDSFYKDLKIEFGESMINKLANIEKEKQKNLDQDVSRMKGKFWSQVKNIKE